MRHPLRSVRRGAWIVAPIVLASILSVPARAEDPRPAGAGASPTNIRVTVRLGRVEQGKRTVLKSYDLIVTAGGHGSKLLSGSRVPIPTDTSSGTSVVYQNIGFSASAEARLVGDKKVELLAEIEDSRIEERGQGQLPIVETRQLSVNTVLSDGVPLEVTRVETEGKGAGFVEVEADILK